MQNQKYNLNTHPIDPSSKTNVPKISLGHNQTRGFLQDIQKCCPHPEKKNRGQMAQIINQAKHGNEFYLSDSHRDRSY